MRAKRVATIVTALLFLVVAALLMWLMATASRVDPARSKMLFVAAVVQMVFVGLCTALLAVHATRLTKAVLRAIALASERRRE